MICRNCSAEIDDKNEKCPFCRKDPRKRNSRGKGGYILCALIIIAVAAAVFVGLNFDEVKSRIAVVIPNLKAASSTSATTTGSEPLSSASAQSESSSSAQNKAFRLSKAEIKEFALLSRDGKEISKRGLITTKKKNVKSLSQAQFSDFCLQKVSRSPYSWLTVRFEDSTGIVFTGNCATCAIYCTLDENDYIKNFLGTIILSFDGTYVYIENKTVESPTETSTQKETTETSFATETTEVSSAFETKATTEVATEATTEATTSKPDVTVNKIAQSRTQTQTTAVSTTAEKPTTTKPAKATRPSTEPETEEEEEDNENSSTVYITDTGSKYHRSGCSSLSKSKKAISVNEAKRKGYEACKRCKP